MLIKTILILMFLLFTWWFARFAHRDGYQGRAFSRPQEQHSTDTNDKPEPLAEDDPPAVASGLSFRPDGNLKTSVSSESSGERLSHSAQRLQTTPTASGESAEFKSIAAASGITGDDQQEFVASLLRQIDENNRDITLLSAGVQENDELIARVSIQDTQIVELREQLEALEFDSTVAYSNADHTLADQQQQHAERLETLKEELAASQASLATLRSQLAQAQEDSAERNENDLELRRLRSELESVQQEKDQTVSAVDSLGSASPGTGAVNELEAGIRQRDQRIAALEAQLSGPAKKSEAATELKPLFTPPAGHDDLKKIKGIGPKMEGLLNQLGVRTFEQLAGFKQTDINQVSAALNAFPGRIERDDWVGQSVEFFRQQQDRVTAD